jgi:hypothetical protein
VEPLQIVTATPPVEATLRILLNSVPYLIGCAVVRQPAGPDAIAAEVGRNPWLFDRRLTALQLPDDTLPANRGVALDWPVPYQAEWVGVPPRLLIARLVSNSRTVGVLLGTLVTREPLSAQTREAIDLTSELLASAMAMHSAAAPPPSSAVPSDVPSPAAEPASATHADVAAPPAAGSTAELSSEAADRIVAIAAQIAAAVSSSEDARAIGRVLRDAMNEVSEASAFAVALFHADRPEVAYRYKVVGVDPASSELAKQPVDDSASCFAVRNAERWHAFDRSVMVAGQRRRVGVVQVPLSLGRDAIGVVTLQTFREGGFAHGELELITAIVNATASAFERARAAGRFQPSAAAGPAREQRAPATPAAPSAETADDILSDLLVRCAALGIPTAFILGLDPQAGMLRGDRVSGSVEAGGIDRLLGISDARFAVSIDDRHNAIARACREARIVTAPTVHELIQPMHDWNEATLVERLAGGARSTVAPILVDGGVVGALIAGPRGEDLNADELEALRALVASAGERLAGAWRVANGGAGAIDMPAGALQAPRSVHVA